MSPAMALRAARHLPQRLCSRSPTLTHPTSTAATNSVLHRSGAAPAATTLLRRSFAASTSTSSKTINPQSEEQPLPAADHQSTYATNPPPASEQTTGGASGSKSASQQSQQSRYKKRTIPRHCISTSHEILPHKIVGVCGLVQGNTVRVRNVARDYFASVRAIFGGELTTYTDLLKEAREEAIQRMLDDAVSVGANGVVSMRITTSSIAANASELQAYGTAVILENGREDSEDNSVHDSDHQQTSESPTLDATLSIDDAAKTAQKAKPLDVFKPKT